MIISKVKNRYIIYVGYTNDLKNRVSLHNNSKGAKFTKGHFWKVIYKKNTQQKTLLWLKNINLKK